MTEVSDLIVRARRGDEVALGALYDELAPHAHRFVVALRLGLSQPELEDVVQETFLRLFRKLERFDAERPLRPYALGIARRVALEHTRTRRPAGDDLDAVASAVGDVVEHVARGEADGLVQDALAALKPEQRAAIALRHTSRLTMRELADCLSCSIPTARSRLREAARLFTAELRTRGLVPAEGAS